MFGLNHDVFNLCPHAWFNISGTRRCIRCGLEYDDFLSEEEPTIVLEGNSRECAHHEFIPSFTNIICKNCGKDKRDVPK